MKVFGKILKIMMILAVIVAIFLFFWFGVFSATGVPDLPIPLPVGLLEPPDVDVSEHLYDVANDAEMKGVRYVNQLGFPLYEKSSFTADNKFDRANALGHDNKLEDNFYYNIDDFDDPDADDLTALDKAFYLFRAASYNEVMATRYSFFQESGGTADIAGIEGKLMSQAIETAVRTFNPDIPGSYTENNFYQQVNALIDLGDINEVLKQATTAITRGERRMIYNGDSYGFKGALSPTFVKSDDESLSPEEKDYYQPFLAPQSLTIAAGRGTASWDGKVSLTTPSPAVTRDIAHKYIGNLDRELKASEKAEGYMTFKDLFKMKFILDLADEELYDVDDPNPDNRPYVDRVWVDSYGNAVEENSPDAVRFYYDCKMVANVEKINAKNDHLTALKDYTGASPAKFTKLTYRFSVWDTGLMRHWHTIEGWEGEFAGLVKGIAYPNNPTFYSYSKANAFVEDYVQYLVGLSRAKSLYGITYKDGATYKDGELVHDTAGDKSYYDKSKFKVL